MRNWTLEEREAFFEHLEAEGEGIALDGRQSFAAYADDWKARRDDAALALEPSPDLIARILDLPVAGYADGLDWNVRRYLTEMLAVAWDDGYDGKYGMFGNSDWRYDLYGALNRAGIIPGWASGYGIGYRTPTRPGEKASNPEDRAHANSLIAAAIKALGTQVQP